MCWTISEPVPSGAGSRGISSPSAFGPPVEDAIRTTLRVALRGRAATRGAAGAAGAAATTGRRLRALPASAASPTLRASSAVKSVSDSPIAGLATRSSAPSASASTARAPCAGEKADTTTTGTGSALPARSARSTPRPSRPGHVQVQGQRVGAVLVAGGERLVTVGRRRDHVEALASQGIGEDPAHEPRVVGDDDALPAVRDGGHGTRNYAAASSSAPVRANRPSGLSRMTRRSSILAIDSIVCESAVGTASS